MPHLYGLEKLQPIAGKLMAFWLFLLPLVFLFAPVQSSSLFLLISLTSIPFFQWPEQNIKWILMVLAALAVFLIWGGMTSFWSDHTQLVVKRLSRFAMGIPFAFLLFNMNGRRLSSLVPVELVLSLGFMLSALIVIIDWLGGGPVSNFLYEMKGDEFAANMLKPGVSIVSLLGFMLLVVRGRNRDWKFYGLGCLLVLSVFHPAQMLAVKGGMLLAVLALLYCWLVGKGLPWILAAMGISICLVVPFLLTADNLALLTNLEHSMPISLLHRLVVWENARLLFLENSLTGYGLGSSRFLSQGELATLVSLPEAYWDYLPWVGYVMEKDITLMPLHPHSLGLQVLLETGFVGAVLLTMLVMVVVKAITKSFTQAQMNIAFPFFILMLVTMAFSYSIWQSWWLAVQFLLFGVMRLLLCLHSKD